MGKHLVLWEIDQSQVPTDSKERAAAWGAMLDMIKQDIKEGKASDWGCFVGEPRGYTIGDQSDVDLTIDLQRFFPFITFQVFPVMSVEQVEEVTKAMSQ